MNILLSGGIAVGKTSVAVALGATTAGRVIRVREALAQVLGLAARDRRTLQIEGAELDRRTQGRWLVDYLEEQHVPGELMIVDALRTRRQTVPVLNDLPDSHLVHLVAHVAVRRERYNLAALTDQVKAQVPFDEAVAHETERGADDVRDLARLILPTDDLTVTSTVAIIVDHFGLGSAPRA